MTTIELIQPSQADSQAPAFTPVDIPFSEVEAKRAFNGLVTTTNQLFDLFVRRWRKVFDAFWRTPLIYGDQALSMADLQAVLDVDPIQIVAMRTKSAAFLAFCQTHYPEAFTTPETGEALIPARYLTPPYEFTVDGETGAITLTALKAAWQLPE
jgi:hypothetical protein